MALKTGFTDTDDTGWWNVIFPRLVGTIDNSLKDRIELKPIIRDLFQEVVKELNRSNDNPLMQVHIIQYIVDPIVSTPNITCKESRLLIKTLLTILSQSIESSELHSITFQVLNKAIDGVKNQQKCHPKILKHISQSYIMNVAGRYMLRDKLVQLYMKLDQQMIYRISLSKIRELSTIVKSMKRDSKTHNLVSWEVVSTVEFWCGLFIYSFCLEHRLNCLTCSMIQTIVDVINSTESPSLYPFRIHCLNALVELTSKTRIFVPIGRIVVAMIEHVWSQKHLGKSFKGNGLDSMLKVSSTIINTLEYKSEIIEKMSDITFRYLDTFSGLVSFPEMVSVLESYLKSIVTKARGSSMRVIVIRIQKLIHAITRHSIWIIEYRKKHPHQITIKQEDLLHSPWNIYSVKCHKTQPS